MNLALVVGSARATSAVMHGSRRAAARRVLLASAFLSAMWLAPGMTRAIAAGDDRSAEVHRVCQLQADSKIESRVESMPTAGRLADRAAAYLRSQQDAKTGGWRTEGQGPKFPAITGLVVTGLLMDPSASESSATDDPAIARAVAYMLSMQKPDGGIYDAALPSYNTSICVSALSRVRADAAIQAVKKAVDFLRTLQYGEGSVTRTDLGESPMVVGKDDAFYGGVGYGKHGRPDLSNLGWMLDALHDAGVEGDDPAFQRALVFLQRTQMLEKTPDGTVVNDMPYAKGSGQGGFIYATSVNKDQVGVGQSFAGEFEETLSDGSVASRLRSYGSMTYAGFKSYIHADLKRDDPRVDAAFAWIRSNYTLDENPGLGTDGLYYYYVVMARALSAWGEAELFVRPPAIAPMGATAEKSGGQPGAAPTKADDVFRATRWADDLAAKLASLQNDDGSFKSLDDRWMENDPVLITAYALVALREAEKFQGR
jgi:squalene-hopene/tetraprenyl-beta-curcumene cyclase